MKFEHLFRLACAFAVLSQLAGSVAGQTADDTKPAADQPKTWIFLTKGRATDGIERSAIEKMQAAHIANFVRLAGIGKLLTAGPMADPQKILRGIVVVTVTGQTELAEIFEPDPYVKQGFMSVEASPMKIQLGSINTKLDSESLEEFRIAVFNKTNSATAEPDSETAVANNAYCKSIYDDERLRFFATLDDENSTRRGILIFKTLDEGAVKELTGDLPTVKNGQWKLNIFPLYLTTGTLDAAK